MIGRLLRKNKTPQDPVNRQHLARWKNGTGSPSPSSKMNETIGGSDKSPNGCFKAMYLRRAKYFGSCDPDPFQAYSSVDSREWTHGALGSWTPSKLGPCWVLTELTQHIGFERGLGLWGRGLMWSSSESGEGMQCLDEC